MRLWIGTDKGLWRVDTDTCEAESVWRHENIEHIAPDPSRPSTIWVATFDEGVWQSTDGGVSWSRALLDLPERHVMSVSVSSADGRVWVGTEPSRLFVSDDGRSMHELEALQAIPSRSEWSFPPRPWTSHVRWIAPSPGDGECILAGIELGGVMRTIDGGRTWSDHPDEAVRDCHQIAFHPRTTERVVEVGGGGVALSDDAGRTWRRLDAGLAHWYCWALALDPQNPDCFYVSSAPSPRHAHGGGIAEAALQKWADGCWHTLSLDGQTKLDAMPYALICDNGELVCALRDGRILSSNDAGEDWRPVAELGERVECASGG